MKLYLLPDGSVVGPFDDILTRRKHPGRLEMVRATNVDWNQDRQIWEARCLNGKLLVSSTSRNSCLDYEHGVLEEVYDYYYSCVTPTGRLECPKCHCPLPEDHIVTRCTSGYHRVYHGPQGLKLSDFNLGSGATS
jgi:hypothetical protein